VDSILEVVKMIDPAVAQNFLAHHRLAVVGASDDPKSFGNTIYRELLAHGYEAIPVNPNAVTVEGQTCYPNLASVPGDLDGVIVMVNRDKAIDIVRACIDRGIRRVWLFKGLGAPGAVSDEAVQLCRDNGIEVVAGACPLMFLEPVGWFHRAHRAMRRINGSLAKAS
jgi:predicted CoA-binding protein